MCRARIAFCLDAAAEIFGIVRLGSHLFHADGGLISIDHSRHDLPERVDPGSATRLVAGIPLPRPGEYRLVFDLVAEGVTWFETVGSMAVDVKVTVR